jgi:O-glycosyl hydrolase
VASQLAEAVEMVPESREPLAVRVSRRRFLQMGAALTASAAASGLPLKALAAWGTASLSSKPVQVMNGFGASGAWWPSDLQNFAPAVQQQVASMLFDPSGIGLSAYRYNIGGGGVGVTNPTRAPQTFLVSPGQYDWTRDPGGRSFLALAAQSGVPNIVGFANSAPVSWTTNGLNAGGNLSPGAEAAYAGYLADIVTHFQALGIRFAYVSPMNEPDYGFGNGKQEGMIVPTGQRSTLVRAVAGQLASRAPYAAVIADESSQVGTQFNPEAPQWLNVAGTPKALAALAHHNYDFPNSQTLQQARSIGTTYGLPLWCTEICCFVTQTGQFGQQYDPTIANAMVMGNLIWQTLTYANDAAFHWWVACSSAIGIDPKANPAGVNQVNSQGWNDGLLYYDPNYATNGNQQIYVTKRYYAMGNFSRYVRPGDQRYSVSGVPSNLRMLAFSRSGGWTLIVLNNSSAGSAASSFRVQLPNRARATGAVETSGAKSLGTAALPSVGTTGLVSGSVPAQSLTTYTFANV